MSPPRGGARPREGRARRSSAEARARSTTTPRCPRTPIAVASYTLRASLDPGSTRSTGEGTITWRNASRVPQSELCVHLYLNAFKNDRTVFMRVRVGRLSRRAARSATTARSTVKRFAVRERRRSLARRRQDDAGRSRGRDRHPRAAAARRSSPARRSRSTSRGRRSCPSLVFRTGYFGASTWSGSGSRSSRASSPTAAGRISRSTASREFYADFGAYDVTIDMPESFVVGATGALEREARDGGASSGASCRRTCTTSRSPRGTASASATRRPTTASTMRVPVPARATSAPPALELDTARYGLALFRRGVRPLSVRDAHDRAPARRRRGGGRHGVPDADHDRRPGTSRGRGARLLEAVTIHELGHQWFYGLVATNEHAHPFLDEGLNSYAEVDAMEARCPGASFGRRSGSRSASRPRTGGSPSERRRRTRPSRRPPPRS